MLNCLTEIRKIFLFSKHFFGRIIGHLPPKTHHANFFSNGDALIIQLLIKNNYNNKW